MTTIQLLATATVAALAAYLWIGVYAWRAAERRDLDGDTRMLIYGWLPVGIIAAISVNEVAADDDRDELDEIEEGLP